MERIIFRGWQGVALTGALHRAEHPKGGVLLAHCFTCSKDLAVNTRLAKGLADAGYHVLRFDFTGLGESGGDFERSTFVANVGDLVAASQWLIDHKLGPCAMVGHSLGGAATLIAAGKVRPVRAVAIIGAPARADHIKRLIDQDAQSRAAVDGSVFTSISGRTFPVSRRLLEDLDQYDHQHAIARLGKPLLVLHSPEDEIVPVAEGERIFNEASQPKAFEPLTGADHLLTNPDHAATASELLASWFDRML